MVLDIQTQPTVKNGPPRMLFERKGFLTGSRQWDVTSDGQHFLIIKSSEQAEAAQQSALYSYRYAIQNAFADVDNALVANGKLALQLAAQQRLVDALKRYARDLTEAAPVEALVGDLRRTAEVVVAVEDGHVVQVVAELVGQRCARIVQRGQDPVRLLGVTLKHVEKPVVPLAVEQPGARPLQLVAHPAGAPDVHVERFVVRRDRAADRPADLGGDGARVDARIDATFPPQFRTDPNRFRSFPRSRRICRPWLAAEVPWTQAERADFPGRIRTERVVVGANNPNAEVMAVTL